MKYCPFCGSELLGSQTFFCTECGKELPSGGGSDRRKKNRKLADSRGDKKKGPSENDGSISEKKESGSLSPKSREKDTGQDDGKSRERAGVHGITSDSRSSQENMREELKQPVSDKSGHAEINFPEKNDQINPVKETPAASFQETGIDKNMENMPDAPSEEDARKEAEKVSGIKIQEHGQQKPAKKTSESRKNTEGASTETDGMLTMDDGYDGYYDDILPEDYGTRMNEGIDMELVRKVAMVIAGVFAVVFLSLLVMYI